jgi:hypothetical protein
MPVGLLYLVLFNNAVSSYDYVVLDDGMNNEL